MVNYARVVCGAALLVLLALAADVAAAPAADCADRHYDQRQNGSENYRLNIDGVVIALAPAESLLAAASDIDFSDLLDLQDFDGLPAKPKPPADNKPDDSKPQEQQAPEPKPQEGKPESPLSDVSLSNEVKGQKKEVPARKNEKAQRLKMRLANMLLPLLKRNRHH